MKSMLVVASISSFTALGCRYPNCDDIVNNLCAANMTLDDDAGTADVASTAGLCTSSSDCDAAMVCDVSGTKRCVQCTPDLPQACTGKTPSCGPDQQCHPCARDSDCTLTNLCLSDGSCAADADFAYADADGTANDLCAREAPCTSLAKALATGRPYVRVRGTIDEAVVINGGRVVTIFGGERALLTNRTGTTAALTITDDATAVDIHDLAIGDIPNKQVYGILIPPTGNPSLSLTRVTIANNSGLGVSATSGTLAMTQSRVSNNRGGGMSLGQNVKFMIVANVFVDNGSTGSAVGALDISAYESMVNRLDFNTFYQNRTQSGLGSTINCEAGDFTARYNIVVGTDTVTNPEQLGGSCEHVYSIVQPGTLPDGAGNKAIDPLFKNPALRDVHLDAKSPAIRAAPDADLSGLAARDFENNLRTSPATLGAYQAP